MVRDALGVLLVEVEAVLHQELHRLGFDDIILRAEEGQVVDLAEVRVLRLRRERAQSDTGLPFLGLPLPGAAGETWGNSMQPGWVESRLPPVPYPPLPRRAGTSAGTYLLREPLEARDAKGQDGARPGGAADGLVPLFDAPGGRRRG